MTYNYEAERPFVFTEAGQTTFLSIRDRAWRLTKVTGAVTMGRLIAGEVGNSWSLIACVDRLVEIGELKEVPNPFSPAGQNRIFIGYHQ